VVAVAPITFTRLLPDRATIDAEALAAALEPDAQAPPERPYTVANFVSTVDGKVTFDGRSGPIGDDGDRALFHALRERVDAVLAGTGTLRAERYGRILGRPERRRRRLRAGRSAEPLACVITRSGRLPLEISLFAEPEAEIVVFSPAPIELEGVAATIHAERYEDAGERPLAQVMRRLRLRYGVRLLLCEGGSSLFASLLAEQLVDELLLTLAPKLASGSEGPTLATGISLPQLQPLRIRWLLARNESLYLRYAIG
jgi:riboflavin biosynthesis pyrimidine reductase